MPEHQTDELDQLLDRVSCKLSIQDFNRELSRFWTRELRQRKHLHEIRFSRGRCKKLMDEIQPVAKFLRWKRITSGHIRFQLDNRVPDCIVWKKGESTAQGIEVTVAQGKARFYMTRELAAVGLGRGFMELQDDAEIEQFEGAFNREADGYTTDQALDSLKAAIKLCLQNKNDRKYGGLSLLIHGPLNVMILPRQRWSAMKGDLIEAAKDMPFREIHVIGDGSKNPICFQIK